MPDDIKPTLSFKVSTAQQPEEKPSEEVKTEIPVEMKQPEPVIDVKGPEEPSLAEVLRQKEDDFEPKKSWSKALLLVPVAALCLFGYWYGPGIIEKGKEAWKHNISSKAPPKAEKPVEAKVEPPVTLPPEIKEEPKKVEAAKVTRIAEQRELYIRIEHSNGKISIRTGGSRSWRNANPCSLLYGTFAKSQDALGGDLQKNKNGYTQSIFETYEQGRNACFELLFKSDHGYKQLSIQDAIKRFAPASEDFKQEKYMKAMKANLGVPLTVKMTDLSDSKKEKMIDILLDVEDFLPGKVFMYKDMNDFKERGH